MNQYQVCISEESIFRMLGEIGNKSQRADIITI